MAPAINYFMIPGIYVLGKEQSPTSPSLKTRSALIQMLLNQRTKVTKYVVTLKFVIKESDAIGQPHVKCDPSLLPFLASNSSRIPKNMYAPNLKTRKVYQQRL